MCFLKTYSMYIVSIMKLLLSICILNDMATFWTHCKHFVMRQFVRSPFTLRTMGSHQLSRFRHMNSLAAYFCRRHVVGIFSGVECITVYCILISNTVNDILTALLCVFEKLIKTSKPKELLYKTYSTFARPS